jgi:hypothetical protein
MCSKRKFTPDYLNKQVFGLSKNTPIIINRSISVYCCFFDLFTKKQEAVQKVGFSVISTSNRVKGRNLKFNCFDLDFSFQSK